MIIYLDKKIKDSQQFFYKRNKKFPQIPSPRYAYTPTFYKKPHNTYGIKLSPEGELNPRAFKRFFII
jgi:hypothetical protein